MKIEVVRVMWMSGSDHEFINASLVGTASSSSDSSLCGSDLELRPEELVHNHYVKY